MSNNPTGEAGKQALIDRLAVVRNELLAIVRELPGDLLLAPVLDDAWSTKDIIGHIASWENRLLTLAQRLINGEGDKIEWIGDDASLQAWNRAAYLNKRDWPWDETIRELVLIREELLWNLGWSTPEQLFAEHPLERGAVSAAEMIEGVVEHDVEHTAQLRAWLVQHKKADQ
jgi:uncharacterized damage-inducible protein DinB